MFLVNTRFHELIKRWPAIFLYKKPTDGRMIHLDIYKQPKDILDRFFMLFGDYVRTLVIDDICMYVAIKIAGYCPDLQMLYVKSLHDIFALDFISEVMPQVSIKLRGP